MLQNGSHNLFLTEDSRGSIFGRPYIDLLAFRSALRRLFYDFMIYGANIMGRALPYSSTQCLNIPLLSARFPKYRTAAACSELSVISMNSMPEQVM